MPNSQSQATRPSTHDSRLGDGGDYYHPERHHVRTPELALAAQFLLATESEAPEVRQSLRFEVYPLLPREHVDFRLFQNRDGGHDLYTDDWLPPRPIDGTQLTLFELHPMSAVILALRDWARRFRLASPRLVEVAVAALQDWLLDEEVRDLAAPEDRWGLGVEYLAHGWSAYPDPDCEKTMLRQALKNNLTLFPFTLSIATRWDARLETEQEFKTRMRERLEAKLRAYTAGAKMILEARGYRRVPRKTAGHHLLWLVQYQLNGLTCDAIADAYADANPQLDSSPAGDAVAKAIRRTAGAMSLQLRTQASDGPEVSTKVRGRHPEVA